MGNSSQKETSSSSSSTTATSEIKKNQEENQTLVRQRSASQLKRPVTVLLIGEENSGKDTICMQLLKKAKEDAQKEENNSNKNTNNTNSNSKEEEQPTNDEDEFNLKPSDRPELYHLRVPNPSSVFAALNNTSEKPPQDLKTLRFNLVTLPGSEQQREQFWTEKTFRGVAGAECDLKENEAFFADGLVFVVDASDKEKVERASKVLHEVLHQKHLEKCPIIIFANKQDLPNAMKPKEVEGHMKLIRVPGGRLWCVLGCSATRSGEELYDGLNWLLENRPERS